MKVRELIEELMSYNDDAEVYMSTTQYNGYAVEDSYITHVGVVESIHEELGVDNKCRVILQDDDDGMITKEGMI